jgi:hypothetical protein
MNLGSITAIPLIHNDSIAVTIFMQKIDIKADDACFWRFCTQKVTENTIISEV